jgi:hypothetical protein
MFLCCASQLIGSEGQKEVTLSIKEVEYVSMLGSKVNQICFLPFAKIKVRMKNTGFISTVDNPSSEVCTRGLIAGTKLLKIICGWSY